MRRSREFLKRFIPPVILVLLVGAAASVAYVRAVRVKVVEYRDGCVTLLERELPRHLVRVDRVKTEPFFTEKRAGGDAAAFFQPRAEFWTTALGGNVGLDAPYALQREVLNGWETLDEPTRQTIDELDASWLHELRQFGFWSATPPVGASKARASLVSFWARVALLKAYWAGDVVAASGDARHAAWLLMTTESLPAFMDGLAILRFERKLHDRQPALAVDVTPLSFEVLDDAAAVGWFVLAALDSSFSTESVRVRALNGVPTVIACTSKSQNFADASLMTWLRGEVAASISPTADCRFDDARRAADEWTRSKRSRRAPSTPVTPVELTRFEHLGSLLVRHLAPELGWNLYADLDGPPLCNAGLMKQLDRQSR